MEDRHTVVTSFHPLGRGGVPCPDGVNRSFAAVYDGHNGSRAAEECSSRSFPQFVTLSVCATLRTWQQRFGRAAATSTPLMSASQSGSDYCNWTVWSSCTPPKSIMKPLASSIWMTCRMVTLARCSGSDPAALCVRYTVDTAGPETACRHSKMYRLVESHWTRC